VYKKKRIILFHPRPIIKKIHFRYYKKLVDEEQLLHAVLFTSHYYRIRASCVVCTSIYYYIYTHICEYLTIKYMNDGYVKRSVFIRYVNKSHHVAHVGQTVAEYRSIGIAIYCIYYTRII
jgi:hypothetical protein